MRDRSREHPRIRSVARDDSWWMCTSMRVGCGVPGATAPLSTVPMPADICLEERKRGSARKSWQDVFKDPIGHWDWWRSLVTEQHPWPFLEGVVSGQPDSAGAVGTADPAGTSPFTQHLWSPHPPTVAGPGPSSGPQSSALHPLSPACHHNPHPEPSGYGAEPQAPLPASSSSCSYSTDGPGDTPQPLNTPLSTNSPSAPPDLFKLLSPPNNEGTSCRRRWRSRQD